MKMKSTLLLALGLTAATAVEGQNIQIGPSVKKVPVVFKWTSKEIMSKVDHHSRYTVDLLFQKGQKEKERIFFNARSSDTSDHRTFVVYYKGNKEQAALSIDDPLMKDEAASLMKIVIDGIERNKEDTTQNTANKNYTNLLQTKFMLDHFYTLRSILKLPQSRRNRMHGNNP